MIDDMAMAMAMMMVVVVVTTMRTTLEHKPSSNGLRSGQGKVLPQKMYSPPYLLPRKGSRECLRQRVPGDEQ